MRELLYAVDEQDRVHTLSAYTLLITHHIYISLYIIMTVREFVHAVDEQDIAHCPLDGSQPAHYLNGMFKPDSLQAVFQ